MKRNTWNFIVDGVTLMLFGGLAWTGFLMHYVLPPRYGRAHGTDLLLWGWDRHDYGQIHFYLALGMLALIVIHVWLHWSWVCSTVSSLLGRAKVKYGWRIIYGVIFFLILAAGTAGSLVWTNAQVEHIVIERGRESGKHNSSIQNIGQMSLQEISQKTEIPVEQIIAELNLPADIDVHERLGRLRRQYAFETEDVRQVIENHREK